MEVHVQELIDSIRKDGVTAAEAEAKKIIEKSEKEASRILKDAEQKAEKLVKDGEASVERRKKSAEAALDQAGRDLLLSVEKKLVSMIESILAVKISEAVTGKTLEKMLIEIAKHDLASSESDLVISKSLYDSLSKELLGELKKNLSKGAEIKPVKNIDSGFRIQEKKGSGYVSFTAEDLASLLSAFLSPELQKLIHESAKS